MRIVGRELLSNFVTKNSSLKAWIVPWQAEVEDATWRTPQDIKSRYPSVSFLSGNKVIFNVKGNHYRLVCIVAFKTSVVVVKWIGTHAQYSKLKF